ncbi:MAG: TIGR02206 family membrane protein [Rickettsiales bacterium]|nr:TIGR02206 family membrane protein [Pseudomonadota bacterium]MDG4544118.1 TIGR02206 family membrane protein [Rickettsiales bacterium]MDG4546299.1 TIGR02206 family membrane protein [Rickettsiales bacterium]MDG4548442.1 TIGR02206 family membrane protein [Rickettsiales bacterium]
MSLNLHLIILGASCAIIYLICFIGKKGKKNGCINNYSNLIGYTTLALYFIYNVYYFLPENFKWSKSLPLQPCDIIALIAGLSMIFPKKIFSSILYFSGLGITTQAFITPIGNQDPTLVRFWLFWGIHVCIISCAFYDLFVRNYKPSFSDFKLNILIIILYFLIIVPINVYFEWNYGFLGNQSTKETTLLTFLGEWPQRILWIILICLSMQTLLLFPWIFFNKVKNKNE